MIVCKDLFFYTIVFCLVFGDAFSKTVYISKDSMASCWQKRGYEFKKCCMSLATDKKPQEPVKQEYLKCEPGQYVPKDATNCSPCEARPFKDRNFCPGGIFEVPQSIIQGVWACDDEEVTSESRDSCVKENLDSADSEEYVQQKYVKCNPGQYLPANAENCATCKPRYYVCVGGEFMVSSKNQGLLKCPSNQIANSDKTKCEQNRSFDNLSDSKQEKECEPGKYLKKIFNVPVCGSCPDGYACPGGTQDKIKCDENQTPNSDKTKCIGLSDMTEKQACEYWTIKDGYWHEEHKTCVPTGGSLWEAQWDSKNKIIECLNLFDAQKWHDAEWLEEQKTWYDNYREQVYDKNGNLKPAVVGLKWDRNMGKCSSEIERQCLANGDTYDWFGTCYKHANDEYTCKNIIGGKWENVNGQKTCNCNIDAHDYLLWTPTQCSYQILLETGKGNGTRFINQENTGPHKFSSTIPLEYCLENYKNSFLREKKSEPKYPLKCK